LDEDVGMAYVDVHSSTFMDYRPTRLAHVKCLKAHTDAVTETGTLAATPLPALTYKIHLPKPTILEGKLSSLQLETIMYACQQVSVCLSLILRNKSNPITTLKKKAACFCVNRIEVCVVWILQATL
jgi:hypothetical protein